MSEHLADPSGGFRKRLGMLPGLLDRAPVWLVLGSGAALLALGVVIVSRPLTSLTLLGVYIGVSCVVTGVMGLVSRRQRTLVWDAVFAAAWIVAGILVLAWLGRSLQLLPGVVAIVLVVSGVGRLAGVLRGPLSSRVLAGSVGVSEITFGALALLWPDATLIVVAVLFGVRTGAFGLTLLWRGVSALASRRLSPDQHARTKTPGRRADVARWIAAVAALALACGAGVVSHTLRSGVPVLDAFYSTPADLPDGAGVLLRSSPWPGTPPADATVTRILYTTTGIDGGQAVASAIVVVPRLATSVPRTVIAWDHGTTGVARACAPSLMNDMFQIQGIPAVDAAVAQGWAIVATDYTGQGTEGSFPYLIGEGEGRSTLDAVRAAHQLQGIDLSDDTVIWGHSQGGHAALWTAKLAPDYAPELTMLGVAALSPAADPWALADTIQAKGVQGPLGVIASWVLVPYSDAYPDVNVSDYVAPAGRGLVAEYATRCVKDSSMLVSVLSSMALSNDQPLYASDLVGGAAGDRLRENKASGPFALPVFIAWGSDDEVIPATLQHDYVAGLCAAGQPVEYREYPGFTHMGVLGDDSGLPHDLIAWTQDRIADRPTVDSCPSG